MHQSASASLIGKSPPDGFRTLVAGLAFGVCAVAAIAPALAMVGGAPTAPAELSRSVVLIVGSAGTACTATVIAPDLLLTVAHCALPGADYKLAETHGRRVEPVSEVVALARHPQFELKKLFGHVANADVALLKLAPALPAKFSPARLGEDAAPIARRQAFVVAGYGVSVRGEPSTLGTLRAATLVASGDPGPRQLSLVDPRTNGERGGLGACTSDSGAPVFRRDGGTLALIGMVSWSTGPNMRSGCGGLTGVTRLAPYHAWIVEAARQLGSPIAH